MMRWIQMLPVVLLATSCYTISDSLKAPRQSVGSWSLGTGRSQTYGLWSPKAFFADGVEEPFDTTWTSVMLNPTHIAFDDTFLVVRNNRGRYLLTAKRSDDKEQWKTTRSEKRYLELRAELGIPDSLVLRPIP